jgi:hypothetical protein
MMPKPFNRRVHFASQYSSSEATGSGGNSMWKPDFVTMNMYHGVPDLLSRAEAAQVDAEMSVDPECRCRDFLAHTQMTVFQYFSS